MGLFEDIIAKADTPAKQSEDKTVEQLVEVELKRLLNDQDYLRGFHWMDLKDNQRDFYIENTIRHQARENVMAPIGAERKRVQDENQVKDRSAYLNKKSTDRGVIVYLDGKRTVLVGEMQVKCPGCGEILSGASHYIGDYFWREGLVIFRRDAHQKCGACGFDTHISVVVAP
jgi:hypothetical protein